MRADRVFILSGAGILAVWLGGCAAAVAPRLQAAGPSVDRSAHVLASPQPDLQSQPWDWPEYARRDAALGAAPPRAVLASDQWPEPARPELTRPRYLYLWPSERTHVFFVPEPRRR
jgi:hypothetical protein